VRQRSASSMGLDVSRETRHFDAATGVTVSLRKKEMEDDYGYIVEPDLVRISLGPEWVAEIASRMPELPDMRIRRLVEQYGVSGFQAGVIVNAGLAMSTFYEECCALYRDPVRVASWLATYLMKSLNYMGLSLRESKVRPETFVELLELIDEGVISERLAKELVKEYVETGASPRLLVKQKGLGLMVPDELQPVVAAVVAEYPRAAEDYASGRVKAMEYLLGQVLRRVRARARPEQVRSLLLEEIDRSRKLPR